MCFIINYNHKKYEKYTFWETFAHEYGHNIDRYNQPDTYNAWWSTYSGRENSAIRRVNPIRSYYGKPDRYYKYTNPWIYKFGDLKP